MNKRKSSDTNKLLLLWYSYPRIAVGLMLIAINLAVIVLFTALLALVSGNGFFDELAYLFTYTMCSDGIYDFVNNQEDMLCFIIKIILTIIQMLIFSGALIGFTTDLIQNTFDNRLQNKGKMHLKNHFVFLNWSTIGQNIIYDLSFLEGEKTVVILTEDEREDVINSIDNIFVAHNKKRKRIRIFVKNGNPTSSKHLEDISISEAKHVGVLLPNYENDLDHDLSTRDLATFKLMLAMMGVAPKANIVVETETEIAKEKIENLIDSTYPEHRQRISVFSHNAVMGHMLGRITINPAFSSLFHHVLSFDGVEFYGIPTMDLEEALYTYNDCIPIINYDDNEMTDADGNKQADQLYILSESECSLGVRTEKKSFVKPIEYCENVVHEAFTLFVFSDSNRARYVVDEIKNSNLTYHTNITYELFSYRDNIEEVIRKIENTEGKKKILMLSREAKDVSKQDAAVFLLLLHLKTHSSISKDIEIDVELVNIDNLVPVRNLGIASIILTNKIISLYMLQLLTHGHSRKFFKDILLTNANSGNLDFEIIPAKQLLVFKEDLLEFSSYSELVQSFYIASNKKRMLVGYYPSEIDEPFFFCNDMDKRQNIQIEPNHRLIVVTY